MTTEVNTVDNRQAISNPPQQREVPRQEPQAEEAADVQASRSQARTEVDGSRQIATA